MSAIVDNMRVGREHDRRYKLTDEDREDIKRNIDNLSIHSLSKKYKVSRRLIQFILFPERAEKNKINFEARGGWKQYYNKDVWKEVIREHRAYKKKLLLESCGTITHIA